MSLVSIVGYVFAAAVTVSCIRHLARGGLKDDFAVFRGQSWKTWLEVAVGDLAAISVLAVVVVVSPYAPAWLQFSWLMLLAGKGETVQATNQMIVGAQIPLFGIAFVLLLILNLPRLAAAEEDEFRLGTKNWLHAIPRSLAFGLMHMIVGLPLWCGLALAIPGMWFTAQYFRGGVMRSTMAHALYNFMLVGVLFVYVVISNFQMLSPGVHSHKPVAQVHRKVPSDPQDGKAISPQQR
jgi:hypothetical protein